MHARRQRGRRVCLPLGLSGEMVCSEGDTVNLATPHKVLLELFCRRRVVDLSSVCVCVCVCVCVRVCVCDDAAVHAAVRTTEGTPYAADVDGSRVGFSSSLFCCCLTRG
jgi:hypothetical protein